MAVDIGQIHKGMHVHASDGTDLGEVRAMWPGIDPTSTSVRCNEEVCSRIEVRQGKGRQARTLFIPYNALAGVSGDVVTLRMGAEAANAKGWARRPGWLPRKAGLFDGPQPDRIRIGLGGGGPDG